jgi:hypothetical protein
MMVNRKKNLEPRPESEEELVCGSFSKRDAAAKIAGGVRHLHSSPLGMRDPCARLTRQALEQKKTYPFPWESSDVAKLPIATSATRVGAIQEVVSRCGLNGRRGIRDRAVGVLEELLSNAIYHAYRNADGSPKYLRRDSIVLGEKEKVGLGFKMGPGGLFPA